MKHARRLILFMTVVSLALGGYLYVSVSDLSEISRNILTVSLLVSGVLFAVMLIWEVASTLQSWQLPDPEDPPMSDISPKVLPPEPVKPAESVIDKAIRALEEAEEHQARVNGRVRIELDITEDDDEDDDE